MILKVKHTMSFYRRFQTDIWGFFFSRLCLDTFYLRYGRFARIVDFFFKSYLKKKNFNKKRFTKYIYRIDIKEPIFRKRQLSKRFISLRLVKFYYIIVNYAFFKRIMKKALKMDGFFELNYCYLLECRLFPLLFRTNFFTNLFFLMNNISRLRPFLNFLNVIRLNLNVKVGDILHFPSKFFFEFRLSFMKRFVYGHLIFNIPAFLESSTKIFMCILLNKPKKRDLVFPFNLDIYRAGNFY